MLVSDNNNSNSSLLQTSSKDPTRALISNLTTNFQTLIKPEAQSLSSTSGQSDAPYNNINQQQQLQLATTTSNISSSSSSSPLSLSSAARFDCLVAYDKRVDTNLVVKWHHEQRSEPIFQWIPELGKRAIAPIFKAHLIPSALSSVVSNNSSWLDAGFWLVRPSKEFGG